MPWTPNLGSPAQDDRGPSYHQRVGNVSHLLEAKRPTLARVPGGKRAAQAKKKPIDKKEKSGKKDKNPDVDSTTKKS